jgi:ABC-2 type transport system permease protein
MSAYASLKNEFKFSLRDKVFWLWMLVILTLSGLACTLGSFELKRQQATIERLIEADREDREAVANKLKDWGSAAYYSFHLTYDSPSEFAYAAMGQRDSQAWKHRVRMLALEGQIYESDIGNPSVALIGRFDFAFIAAFIFPLILIILLHDLKARERQAGRDKLLEATVLRPRSLWLSRLSMRLITATLCLVLPMLIAGTVNSVPTLTLLSASILVVIYAVFWAGICYCFAAWQKPASTLLMSLISLWLLMAVVIPAGLKLTINQIVSIPSGSDILLLQRETVNDAWDLPREQTMDAFFERHPQWADYEKVEGSFEWQWYYAFQQVGDQVAEPVVDAYRRGKQTRDQAATIASLLSPPSLLERCLEALADTDQSAMIDYENRVRQYHASLREFYYPKFFENQAFDKAELANRPQFVEPKK